MLEAKNTNTVCTRECGNCVHCKYEESNKCDLLKINENTGVMLDDCMDSAAPSFTASLLVKSKPGFFEKTIPSLNPNTLAATTIYLATLITTNLPHGGSKIIRNQMRIRLRSRNKKKRYVNR